MKRLSLIAAGVFLFLTIHIHSTRGNVELPEEEWVSCQEYKQMATLPNCLCAVTEEDTMRINCDHVSFAQDFPNLPFRQPIVSFSQRYVNYQNIPPQALLASGAPLQSLDLSHNWLRRLTEKSLEGLSETLEVLDLSYNLLGDQLNPIFSTSEFKKLPRLKSLSLGHNLLSHIDGGILEGCLSLQEIYLDNNEIKSVPATSFKGPNALRIVDLSENEIDDIRPDDFVQAASLLFLNVSSNKIIQIQGNAFRGLSSLKVLDLSWNRIQRLNSDSLAGLATIEEIDLSNNFLTQIPVTALKVLSTLRVLRLSANLLQNLEGTTMKAFSSLEYLDLSRNRLSELPRGFFSGLARLKEINLGVNQLRTLPSTVFEGLPNIRKINLMDNNLLAFPSSALDPLISLTSLTLDYNRISALTPMKIQNLTKLSISNNLIREIPADTFSNFPQLSYLNLKGNLIENLDDVALPIAITELNLGLNNLKTIPRFQLPNLEVLNLAGNQVNTLLQHNFVLLSSLVELDLRSNMVHAFYANSFDGLESLAKLDLSGNRIEYLPKFGNLLQIEDLNFSKNLVKEIGIIENMEALRILDLSYNQISNLRPDTFRNTTNLISINLRNNKLNSFKGFTGSFERLKSLNLQQNQISYVYPNSFENFGHLWNLDLTSNRFTFFPTEFLKPCKQLRYIGLAKNQIKNLNEMNFSNFPHLRHLDLSGNAIEFIIQNAFLNSTQLQLLNFSGNKLESVDANIFHGLLRLSLDLSNNYLSYLPPNVFDRNKVQKLQKINLSKNAFQSIPSESLQKQYFFLETLDMSDNKITEVPQNLNILVNVKTLDLSRNPINENSLRNILNEPKTVRYLSLANCSIKTLPVLEMPFLRSLNLSSNFIRGFDESVFKRTTLLETLSLASNQFFTLDSVFPGGLKSLDLSNNPLGLISGNHFPLGLEELKLNDLDSVLKVEKTALNLKSLKSLELYNLPKLGYLDIRGLLTNLNYLESFDFEVKDHQIVDQIHPGLNARVRKIGLRGRRVRSISTGAFAGLTSPDVSISLINTSLSLLPSILVPVPMSSNIILDLKGSKITNLSPPFLSQNIKLQGLTPICDCNAANLVKYLQIVESNVLCSGPKNLEGHSVLDLRLDDLVCESGSSTTPPPIPSTISTTTTTQDDIIWSLPPSTTARSKSSDDSRNNIIKTSSKNHEGNKTKLKVQDINNMDNLIIGIVGGVVGLIVLFIFIIVCFVRLTNSSSSDYPATAPSVVSCGPNGGGYAPSKCTCPHKTPTAQQMMAAQMMSTNYATVSRSNGKLMQGYPSSLPATFNGGGIYAIQGGPAGYSNIMTMGPGGPAAYNASYNAMGPSSIRQQQLFTSLPYYVQEPEYESRR